MSKLITKARSGVTLVELLVVILIVTILSVSLLPLLKPYIEQAKYAAEVQPTLANVQTKINLYQYEKDRLPSTVTSADGKTENEQDDYAYSWEYDETNSEGAARVYKKLLVTGLKGGNETKGETEGSGTEEGGEATTTTADLDHHLSNYIDVDWQDVTGKRLNPSHFKYHVIKGLGAACYGYALGVFGDGEGLAKGTGYAILVLVDTNTKIKIIGTWERYKPATDEQIVFLTTIGQPSVEDNKCRIPAFSDICSNTGASKSKTEWSDLLYSLKKSGWSFNYDDYAKASE